MVKAGRLLPARAERADRVDDERRLFDRVDGAAVAPVRLPNLRVPGPAGYPHDTVLRAAAGNPDLEARRLRHDCSICAKPSLHERGPAGSRGLLVGVRRDEQLAGELDVLCDEPLECEDHRRNTAFHVARAAPVEATVAHLGCERIARPALAGGGGDDVDMPVEDE